MKKVNNSIEVILDRNELYPVYIVSSSYGRSVDIPKDLLDEYHVVMRKFDDIQKKLSKIYNK